MDGQAQLVQRLQAWARSAGVTPVWVRGLLRLQSDDGTAKAVVTFPKDFWTAFELASPQRQVDALDVIEGDVQALYDAGWKQFEAKTIEVHSALLKET